MAVKWEKTDYPGVRYYEHPTRKVARGAVKYPDKYFAIRYQQNGKRMEEGLGWSSAPEKWTAEKAFAKLTELKGAAKNSLDAPKRFKEERERNAQAERARENERERVEEEKKRKERENVTAERFFYDTYWPTVPSSRKPGSKPHDETHFRLWLAPVFGNKPLKSVGHLQLEKVKKNMLEAGKAPRTLQYVFATFRQIWNKARHDKIVFEDSPTKAVKLPKFNNERKRFLTQQEAGTLLKALKVRDVAVYQMAALSLFAGLRASEIFALTWGDFDRARGTIYIADPKNHESRFVFINKPIADLLETMTPGESQELVFKVGKGPTKGQTYGEIPDTFDKTVKALGLNDGITDKKMKLVFHSLRHTFASWLIEHDTQLLTITKLTGHKTLAMGKRYAHLLDKTLREKAELLESVEPPVLALPHRATRMKEQA